MAPYEPLTTGAQVVLLDVLQTLQRLESGLSGQDKRLFLVEQYIRSGSISPVTSSSDGHDDVFSIISGKQSPERTQSSVTPTSPRSPVSIYRESVEAARRKFQLEDSDDDDEEAAAPAKPAMRLFGQSQIRQDVEARSVSVYSRHPSQLALNTFGSAASAAPAVPERSPWRRSSGDQEQTLFHRDELVAVAYETAFSGPAPSRVKPAEVYAGTAHQARDKPKGVLRRVLGLFSARRGRVGKAPQFEVPQLKLPRLDISRLHLPRSFRPRRGHKADVEDSSVQNVEPVQMEFGLKGLWRAMVLALSDTHRSRPYIVA